MFLVLNFEIFYSSSCLFQRSALASIGGESADSLLRTILSRVMANSCAEKFSYHGSHGAKGAFKTILFGNFCLVIFYECSCRCSGGNECLWALYSAPMFPDLLTICHQNSTVLLYFICIIGFPSDVKDTQLLHCLKHAFKNFILSRLLKSKS